MGTSGGSQSGPGGAGAEYRPPSRGGRMLLVFLVLLIVTNLITGAAVFYLAVPAAIVPPLRVIGPWAASEKDKFIPVLDLFKNKTGIPYEYITTRQEDLQSLLPNWFAARRAPADLIFMPSSFVKQYGKDGNAADLTGTITESNYAAGALDPLKDAGKLYGGADTGKVEPGFWYRQSFFTAPRFQPPTPWAQFVSLLR